MAERRSQIERSTTTRAALVAAGRELFAERGYAGTGREDIAERAGVTRGALYHHFESKAALFRAVVEAVDGELSERIVGAASQGRRHLGRGPVERTVEPVDAIRRGALAYIAACADADVARIMLDARSVLDGGEVRAISNASCRALLLAALEQAASAGAELPGDVEILASVLLAALDEAALLVAAAPRSPSVRRRVTATVDELLTRLLRG